MAMERVEWLRRDKVTQKGTLTHARRGLLVALYEDNVSKENVKERLDELIKQTDKVTKLMLEFAEALRVIGKENQSVFQEIDMLQTEFNSALDKASEVLENFSERPSRARTGGSSPATVDRARKIREVRKILTDRVGTEDSNGSGSPDGSVAVADSGGVEAESTTSAVVSSTSSCRNVATSSTSPTRTLLQQLTSSAPQLPSSSAPQLPSYASQISPSLSSASQQTLSAPQLPPSALSALNAPQLPPSALSAPQLPSYASQLPPSSAPPLLPASVQPSGTQASQSTGLQLPPPQPPSSKQPTWTSAQPAQPPSSAQPPWSSAQPAWTSAQPVQPPSSAQPPWTSAQPPWTSAQPAWTTAQLSQPAPGTSQLPTSAQPAWSSAQLSQPLQPPPGTSQLPTSAQPAWTNTQTPMTRPQMQYSAHPPWMNTQLAPASTPQTSKSAASAPSVLSSHAPSSSNVPLVAPQHSAPMQPTLVNSGNQATSYGTSMRTPGPWQQLKKISLPSFAGDKRQYEGWRAAFDACVDRSPFPPEYKLLQLREYLSGEALQSIQNLGYSPAAYQAAKTRLERKFGGERRRVAIRLEELDAVPMVHRGRHKEFERFIEALDVTIVRLKDAHQEEELKAGSLYLNLVKKLDTDSIAQYQRWLSDKAKVGSVEVLAEWVSHEAEILTVAAEMRDGFRISGSDHQPPRTTTVRAHRTYISATAAATSSRPFDCIICQGKHGVWACPEFRKLDVTQRWTKAKAADLCFRCLGTGHQGKLCPRTRTCGKDGCQDTHSYLLHGRVGAKSSWRTGNAATFASAQASSAQASTAQAPSAWPLAEFDSDQGAEEVENRAYVAREVTEGEQPQTDTQSVLPPESVQGDTGVTLTTSTREPCRVSLRTVPVCLQHGAKTLRVNAMLDDCSTATYVSSSVAAELGLKGELQRTTVSVLNGQIETFATRPVAFTLLSTDGEVHKIDALTTDKPVGSLKATDWLDEAASWPHLHDIPFPESSGRRHVDLLIGADYPHLHYSEVDVRGHAGEPIARLTPLGWTCMGPTKSVSATGSRMYYSHLSASRSVTDLLQRFWEVEEPKSPVAPPTATTASEAEAVELVTSSLIQTGGRFQVGLPWNKRKGELSNNFNMAMRRLRNTESRLQRNKEVSQLYHETIRKYLERGYISKVTGQPVDGWYLPHFPIVRLNRETTKVRIVFDAAAKFGVASLNDTILTGPKLQRDLFDVLLRFRRGKIAVACDISEMYLQIGIREEDRPYLRFLWRESADDKAEVYEFNRLVFGLNTSPFIAQFVSRQHATDQAMENPLAAEAILKSTYMDDTLDSVGTEEQAVQLYEQLKTVWNGAGMTPRKWLSNSTALLQRIPQEDRAQSVDLSTSGLPTTKTLGVTWSTEDDKFSFQGKCPDLTTITKRSLLKHIATVFDPMGFIAPYVVVGKILLQQLWLTGCDWDDEVDPTTATRARQWFRQLDDLRHVTVNRCISTSADRQLHVFVDASAVAYGAVAYMRNVHEDGTVECNLVAAKSRVAPLKSVSIPRLELMAAVIGLDMAQAITAAVEVDMSTVMFWSDSVNVLCWIRRPSRSFKPFVANRVAEIQSSTQGRQWRHVPTQHNPADLVSRGSPLQKLTETTLWWEGPELLKQTPSEWPAEPCQLEALDTVEVKKQNASGSAPAAWSFVTMSSIPKQPRPEWRLEPSRWSDWRRLIRTQAWVWRFLSNCRAAKEDRRRDELSADEITDQETALIRQAQQQEFTAEYQALVKGKAPSSRLLELRPQLDSDGLIRCSGRTQNAKWLPHDVRYPIILPRHSWVTSLIVKFHHEESSHGGTNHTLANLSTRYWVVSAREVIREIEARCSRCKKDKAKAGEQVMAPLPAARLATPLRAFARVAVDYAGPFMTVQGRGRTRQKRYLCLFTCLLSRAVHLEMSFGLDTNSFLNAFARFAYRRGLPIEVISDNGSNFIGAERELRELVESLNQDSVKKSLANRGIQWSFNPPITPHFGGVHEIMIKAAKRAIAATLGVASVSDEELTTAISGAESLINSRPLTYQSAHPKDDTPITPNHFLHGQVGGEFAPTTADTTDFNASRRWRVVQELINQFWQRWMREWVPTLNNQRKWLKERRDLQVDDVVLVIQPGVSRGHWPLGRITEVYPGVDGHVRVAQVQVADKVMVRNISRLCPLEC